jgi:hypothetical protein
MSAYKISLHRMYFAEPTAAALAITKDNYQAVVDVSVVLDPTLHNTWELEGHVVAIDPAYLEDPEALRDQGGPIQEVLQAMEERLNMRLTDKGD